MALTRKMLKAMGIEDEKIDQIIEAHTETADALKKERDGYKADAEKLPGVQKALDDLKSSSGDDFKDKYEKEHSDFEAFKAKVKKDDEDRNKRELYKAILRDAGVDEKKIGTILRVTDFTGMEVKDGKLKDAESLTETAKTEWADFIVSKRTDPGKPGTPPEGGKKILSHEEIYKKDDKGRYVLDAPARQKALAELMASEE